MTDDFCGGAILDIDAVSVLGVVSCWGRGSVCVCIVRFSSRYREVTVKKLRILRHFLPSVRSQIPLAPYVLMPVKAVEAVERLAFERESEHVENEPRIMSTTPRPKPAP